LKGEIRIYKRKLFRLMKINQGARDKKTNEKKATERENERSQPWAAFYSIQILYSLFIIY